MIFDGWKRFTSLVETAFRTPIENPPHDIHRLTDGLLQPVRNVLQFVGRGGVPVSVDLASKSYKVLPHDVVSDSQLVASALVYIPCAALGALAKLLSLCDPDFRDAVAIIAELKEKSWEPQAPGQERCLKGDISRELSKRILSQLEPQDLLAAARTCRLWMEVACKDASLRTKLHEAYPAPLTALRNFMRFPHAAVPAHRAGSSDNQLIQAMGSDGAPTPLISMVSPDLLHAPVTHLVDPWGRRAIALRYQTTDGKASVLVLHQERADDNSVWTAGEQPGAQAIFAFFPRGWNAQEKALDYLQRLLAGQPCGHPVFDATGTMTESPEKLIRLL